MLLVTILECVLTMKFRWKFYESIKFQIFSFGFLLSSALNGVESGCHYFENLEPGKMYHTFNTKYPNHDNNILCNWEKQSFVSFRIYCEVDIGTPDCSRGNLTVQIDGKNPHVICGKNTFFNEGIIYANIKFYLNMSDGRFFCNIETAVESDCKCGWKNNRNARIIGGYQTGINEYPMMCSIVDVYQLTVLQNKHQHCGCTIIAEQYVITAGHCLEGRDIREIGILVGEHDIKTSDETNATQFYPLASYIIHPQFYTEKRISDIGICKINGTIEFNSEVGPVCLPIRHDQDSFVNMNVIALGWGLTEFGVPSRTLQQGILNVIPLEQCKVTYPFLNYRNICTLTPRKNFCKGDSGGPLLWQNPTTGNLVLAGIISAQAIGCSLTHPAISMRTGAFINWIRLSTPGARYCTVE